MNLVLLYPLRMLLLLLYQPLAKTISLRQLLQCYRMQQMQYRVQLHVLVMQLHLLHPGQNYDI
jgi:hypothetical protein